MKKISVFILVAVLTVLCPFYASADEDEGLVNVMLGLVSEEGISAATDGNYNTSYDIGTARTYTALNYTLPETYTLKLTIISAGCSGYQSGTGQPQPVLTVSFYNESNALIASKQKTMSGCNNTFEISDEEANVKRLRVHYNQSWVKINEIVAYAKLDVISPPAPAGLTATPGNGEVTLTWSPVSADDLQGYHVYQDGERITNEPIQATMYTVTGLQNGTEYTFAVTAIDDAGNESEPASVTATPSDEPPPAPAGLTATPGNGEVTLTWSPVSAGDLQGYHVYQDGERITNEPIQATMYTVTGLQNGTEYTFAVTAIDDAGNESEPASVTATPSDEPPPVTVPVLSASSGNGVVNLSWTAVPDATEYRIYRDGELIGTTTETEYQDSNVVNGTTYVYRVSAVVAGEEQDKSLAVPARPADIPHFGGGISLNILDTINTGLIFLKKYGVWIVLILGLFFSRFVIDFLIMLTRPRRGKKDDRSVKSDEKAEKAEAKAKERKMRDRGGRSNDLSTDRIYEKLKKEGRSREAERILSLHDEQIKRHARDYRAARTERERENLRIRHAAERRALREQIVRDYGRSDGRSGRKQRGARRGRY